MPFSDQLYYPATLGAKTAIARIALDPPWLGPGIATALRLGLRSRLRVAGGQGATRRVVERLKGSHGGFDRYALVVEVRRGLQGIRASVAGRVQAQATAVGVGAITEALWAQEVDPGVWLPEQVIAPDRFFGRLAKNGIVPRIEGLAVMDGPPTARAA
jgi:hypothetical protein